VRIEVVGNAWVDEEEIAPTVSLSGIQIAGRGVVVKKVHL